MPKFTLRGVEVDFPHDAYDCQVRRGDRVCFAVALCTLRAPETGGYVQQ